jgi:hypothetical protein
MRSAHLIAALAASCVTGFAVDAYAAEEFDFRAQSAGACASGYHPDAGGNCEPDVAEVNRFCPAGGVYHPAPNGGWYCETPQTTSEAQPQPEQRAYHAPRVRASYTAPSRAHRAHHAPHRVAAASPPTDQTRSINSGLGAAVAPISPGLSAPPSISGGGGGGGGAGGGAGGGGGAGWSDRRLKRDIVRLGVSPSGLPIYAFQYVWGGPRYIGAMAQDLLKLRPDAVILDDSGYYKVDYSRIDIEMREESIAA